MARPAVSLSGIFGNEQIIARFMRYAMCDTEAGSKCWLWTGATREPMPGQDEGYGHFRLVMPDGSYRTVSSHRASYALFRGDIPELLHVCHHCDRPRCVNPSHLWLGTHRLNMLDRDLKERGRNGGVGEASKMAKLTAHDIPEIRRRLRAGETCYRIAPDYGVSHAAIYNIGAGKSWGHVADDGPPIIVPKLRRLSYRKLSDDDVRAIRADDRKLHEIAAAFKISEVHAHNIKVGARRGAVPDEP